MKKKFSYIFFSGCSEPLAVGDCKGAFKKFYYNSSTGKVDKLHLKIFYLKNSESGCLVQSE